MRDGFLRVSAVTPHMAVAYVPANGEEIRARMLEAVQDGAKVVVFPELCLTGYTCHDLFFQQTLLSAAEEELKKCAHLTEELDGIFFLGLPYRYKGKLYNVAAAINRGRILGLVPKTNLPNYHEFYERRSILPAIGFDNYYDIDDIWKDTSIPHTNGWQSDKMLIEQAIKHMDETNGKFFCDIITSVMHFPYDESSYWGDYYIDQINEVHPEWTIEFKRYMSKCMDFDAGLKVLLEYLESSGKADNTVICIYPDHRPYWMDYDQVMEATRHIDPLRFGENGIYRSPFIIYNRTIEPEINENYCSTLDHAPTIANLFNLNYDPRLFMGTDAFNGDNIIILANGNWICRDGYYDATTEKFIPNDPSAAVSDAFVSRTNANVQNTIKISYLIMDEDYFSKRRSICSPR